MGTATIRAYFRHLSCHNNFSTFLTVISRDSMSPPDLSGYAPITDIGQPVHISLVHSLWNQFQISVADRLDRRFCQLFHTDKPLLFYEWLYRCSTSFMCSDIMRMIFYFHKESLLFQIAYDCFSRLIALHPCIFSTELVDRSIIVHDVDLRKVMSLPDFKVIRVVCWCDLHRSGSKFLIYIVVCHDRNLSVY